MNIIIVAAIAKNNVIGCKNRLPWYLPADLAHFKRLTLHKSIIMGRKTYESIGHPLPQRDNIIVTSNQNYQAPGCKILHSLQAAIDSADSEDIMVIGGKSLYAQALPITAKMYLTYIDADIEGDVTFPDFDKRQWQEVERIEHLADKKNIYSLAWVTYCLLPKKRRY
ncbi:MAG: dihydrofolate reductase [Pseudomonadota bacterium]